MSASPPSREPLAAAAPATAGRGLRERRPRPASLPNLIVIGAMKCGTSALHYYLDLHPQTSMSHPKELNFFVDRSDGPSWTTATRRAPLDSNTGSWSKGIDWYARHFSADAAVRGESSPAYTVPAWSRVVVARMAAVVPDAKLVFMVRDPIERAVSHYLQALTTGQEDREVADALSDLDSPYVTRSRYRAMLEPFLAHFALTDILIVAQGDLRARKREVMRDVYRFAGVDDTFWSPKLERERNTSQAPGARTRFLRALRRSPALRLAYRLPEDAKWRIERAVSRPTDHPPLPQTLRDRLGEHLRDDVEGLRRLTGRQFADWSI